MKRKVSNNSIKATLCLIIIVLITSCKKLIDIPPSPSTSITQSEQFADSISVMSALAGVYSCDAISTIGFAFRGGTFEICSGLSSDELSYANTTDPDQQQFYNYKLTRLNSEASQLWTNVYQAVYPVNAVISGVAGSNGLSSSLKKQITGEMKVMRSFYFFNMINLYGAVPLITTTDYAIAERMPRTPVDSVYTYIVTDLNDAIRDLSQDYPSAGRARPNQYTAMTLLAKVHLYQKDWQDAYDESNSVIQSGLYSLEPDLDNVFLDGSNEAIWQLPAKGEFAETAAGFNFIPPVKGLVPNYPVTPFLLNSFESGDQRLIKWVGTTIVNVGGNNQTFYYPYKYKNRLSSAPTNEDVMIFRLAEVYLIRAESAAQLGKLSEALEDLNTIRQRSGLPNTTLTDQQTILNEIMHERQIEMFTEGGNRWFDLKRTGTAGSVLSAEKTGWQNNAALYPIPQSQLQLNNQLTQNPGY